MMNRFVKKNKREDKSRRVYCPYERNVELLMDAAACYNSLQSVREKSDRSFRYAWGNQWGDLVPNPYGNGVITEEALIKKQGNQPLKNNVIAPILNNIEGQFKGATAKTLVSSRAQANAKAGDMMTVALEYVHDNNCIDTLDTDMFMTSLCSGIKMQSISYGWNDDKYMSDVWIHNVEYNRCFFNTDTKDPRGWDVRIIGEIFDVPMQELLARFVNARPASERGKMEEYIRNIYGNKENIPEVMGMYDMSDKDRSEDLINFFATTRVNLHRLILVWRKESRKALFVHDTLKGTQDYVEDNRYWREEFARENEERKAMGARQGIAEEDIMLINVEPKTEIYWQYYYMSPMGDVLETGRSPFWHHSHNYALSLYPLRNGKLYNYVEQFIDQQRAVNRTLMMIDFVRGSSARGLLVVDENAFEGMTRERIIDEYTRYNGVLFAKLKPGVNIQNTIQQFNTGAVAAGDFELLNLQLRLINEIAGINSALQGREAKSGMSAKLYAAQTQNSAVNLQGILGSFRAFRQERDYKLMMTVQQYYDSKRYIDVSGNDFEDDVKWYDPNVVKHSKLYLKVTEGHGQGYQEMQNDFLMMLFEKNAIDVMTLLETSNFSFAPRLLETLKRREEEAKEAAAQGQMQGIPQEQMAEVQNAAQNPRLAALMNNSALAGENDGVIMKG